jgi:hypothetical protein
VTAADLEVLSRLQTPLPAVGPPSFHEVLLRTLNLVASYPPDSSINLSSRGTSAAASPITSLCSSTGHLVTGTYTLHGKTHSETVELGPCYNAKNACLGRCGPGCGPPPSATIQAFTQNCLNHDLCTRANGGNVFGDCTGLWLAAAKDFLFAPDCGNMSGNWSDNYTLHWDLVQGVILLGTVETGSCQDWSASGVHSGANLVLTARRRNPNKGCCTAFSYTGKFEDCNNAAGRWTNVCGHHGTWTMSRDGATSTPAVSEGDSPVEGRPQDP